MAYTMHTLIAKSISYGSSRADAAIKYIVLHYTGNETDSAKGNANFFSPNGSNKRKAGAHYFVDSTNVYQSIPDSRTAYSVGGAKYSDCRSTGGGSMYGKITNGNSISIEMCSTGGRIADATVSNAVRLTKMLMARYGISASRVYRHFDVTGKRCPGWNGWTGKSAPLWSAFKAKLTSVTNVEVEDMTEAEVKKIIKAEAAEQAKRAVSSWAADAWQAATSAGVLDGTAPQGNLTREQFAVVLGKLGLIGGDAEPSAWAKAAFDAATDAGILDGTNPHGLVTREQLAQVLKNLQLIGAGTTVQGADE